MKQIDETIMTNSTEQRALPADTEKLTDLGHDLHTFIVATANLQDTLRGRLSGMGAYWRGQPEDWRNDMRNVAFEQHMVAIEDFLDSLAVVKVHADDFIIEEVLGK